MYPSMFSGASHPSPASSNRSTAAPQAPAHFLEAYPETLDRATCEEIIARFEADPRKTPSRTARSDAPAGRSGAMLSTATTEWRETANLICAAIWAKLRSYIAKYPMLQELARPENCALSLPLIERIEPGQGYGYHFDAGNAGTHDRFLSTLIYLRDVAEGGFTEFPFQSIRVPPRAGLMLVFPPFWTHLHRGVSPQGTRKYNITNFLTIRAPAPQAG